VIFGQKFLLTHFSRNNIILALNRTQKGQLIGRTKPFQYLKRSENISLTLDQVNNSSESTSKVEQF